MSEPTSLLSENLCKVLERMLSQIELSFDYIQPKVVNSCRKQLTKIQNNKDCMTQFCSYTTSQLQEYEKDILHICFPKTKISKTDYLFLNKITLFKNDLQFKFFESENKNTKKIFVDYLYNILMCCTFLNFKDDDKNSLTETLSKFIQLSQEQQQESLLVHQQQPKKTLKKIVKKESINDLIERLSKNEALMSIATEVAEEMQGNDIDMASILSSVMTGKLSKNKQLTKILEGVKVKLDQKIASGELDKDSLEKEGKELMSLLKNPADLLNFL